MMSHRISTLKDDGNFGREESHFFNSNLYGTLINI